MCGTRITAPYRGGHGHGQEVAGDKGKRVGARAAMVLQRRHGSLGRVGRSVRRTRCVRCSSRVASHLYQYSSQAGGQTPGWGDGEQPKPRAARVRRLAQNILRGRGPVVPWGQGGGPFNRCLGPARVEDLDIRSEVVRGMRGIPSWAGVRHWVEGGLVPQLAWRRWDFGSYQLASEGQSPPCDTNPYIIGAPANPPQLEYVVYKLRAPADNIVAVAGSSRARPLTDVRIWPGAIPGQPGHWR